MSEGRRTLVHEIRIRVGGRGDRFIEGIPFTRYCRRSVAAEAREELGWLGWSGFGLRRR